MTTSLDKERSLLDKKLVTNYEYVGNERDAKRVLDWIDGRKYFIYDCETGSLNPWNRDVVLYQIGDHRKQWKTNKEHDVCLQCWRASCNRQREKTDK